MVFSTKPLFSSNAIRCMNCQLPKVHCKMCDDEPIDIHHGDAIGPHSWIDNGVGTDNKLTEEEVEAWSRFWYDPDEPDENPFRAYRFTTDGV